MKHTLLFAVAMMFAVSSVLSAAETTKPFNGTNLDGWKFNGNQENCWKVGNLKADETTMEVLPLAAANQQNRRSDRPIRSILQGQRPLQTRQNNVPKGCMINMVDANWTKVDPRKGVDMYTEKNYGDCTVKLEFLLTKGSNSGVYLMGEYEVQVADSFGKPDDQLGQGDMGAIYSATKASTNASAEPGKWQNYEIEFVAPKFDADGKKTANAVFKKITLNGKVVQENVEVKGPTGGGLTMKEAATGPLMLQGNHGPIAFRNIRIIAK